MSEEETNSEERHPTPGIDYVVTREQLDLVDVNQTLAAVASVECFEINRFIADLDSKRPEEQWPAIRLLSCLTSYHFVPDHPTEPFKPMWTMGDRRSLVPTDLVQEQIDVVADFAPSVTHLGLRARLRLHQGVLLSSAGRQNSTRQPTHKTRSTGELTPV